MRARLTDNWFRVYRDGKVIIDTAPKEDNMDKSNTVNNIEEINTKKVHAQYVEKLIKIGINLGFDAKGKVEGKMYELANPDCIWYYKGKPEAEKVLKKIARGDRAEHIPVVAFEVAYSEEEKEFRGSMMSLQLTNAAASVIVLLGKSAEPRLESKLNKLFGRYSYTRFRIWTKKDVDELYNKIVQN